MLDSVEDFVTLPLQHGTMHGFVADDAYHNFCVLCEDLPNGDLHVSSDIFLSTPVLRDFVKAPGPCSLDKSSKHNWVEGVGGLPNYTCQVARAIARGGKSLDEAIPIARGQIHNWASGEGKVSAAVRARAQADDAEWDSKRAEAHAKGAVKGAAKESAVMPNPNKKAEKEGQPMKDGTAAVTASANAGWSETSQFFWDPDANAVYKVDGQTVSTFTSGDWQPGGPDLPTVQQLPSVDDPDTLATVTADGGAEQMPSQAGRKFEIPIVIPEGVPSGDTRSFSKNALEFKEPPMPLLWQKVTDEGHKQSVTVGKITDIERTEAGLGNARGVFDTHPDAVEAARQVEGEFLTGVSGDVDQFKAEMSTDEGGEENIVIHHGRLVAATLVAKPAFQEASIRLVPEEGQQAITASGGPIEPPIEWFSNPKLSGPTHLEVDDNGRVFGHIAAWNTPHMANPTITPPRSKSNYKHFCTGALRTAEGTDVRVGRLTLIGGHADINLTADAARDHYADTRSAFADVACGEDQFGIWVAGALRPDVTASQVRAVRASDPSGDWRKVNGNLELVGVCAVNTAGFPVARSLVASGEQYALVAAGAAPLSRKATLEQRFTRLERAFDRFIATQVSAEALSLAAELRAL